jgi:hypothetical protein
LDLGLFTKDVFWKEVKKFAKFAWEKRRQTMLDVKGGGRLGSDLSIQMMKDVLYEQPPCVNIK